LESLGPSLFCFENPGVRGLDFLGFPWILSSETRLINGLRGKNRRRIFRGVLPLWGTRSAGAEGRRQGYAGAHGSSSKHKLVSDFLQLIVAQPLSPAASIQRRRAKAKVDALGKLSFDCE
jgi:hypothetical protein